MEEEEGKRARTMTAIIYRLLSYGLAPLPRPPGSKRPPVQALPPPTREQLARLQPKSLDAAGQWKLLEKAYAGQTVQEGSNTGANADELLKGRGTQHLKPVRAGKATQSVRVGWKAQEMAAMGLLDLNRPFDGWEKIEPVGEDDQPLGFHYGGRAGVLEAVGVVKAGSRRSSSASG